MAFKTKILQGGKMATGINVPDTIVEQLGAGKRPLVSVTINGYTYRSAIAVMGESTCDVSVPAELKKALAGDPRERNVAKAIAMLRSTG